MALHRPTVSAAQRALNAPVNSLAPDSDSAVCDYHESSEILGMSGEDLIDPLPLGIEALPTQTEYQNA